MSEISNVPLLSEICLRSRWTTQFPASAMSCIRTASRTARTIGTAGMFGVAGYTGDAACLPRLLEVYRLGLELVIEGGVQSCRKS